MNLFFNPIMFNKQENENAEKETNSETVKSPFLKQRQENSSVSDQIDLSEVKKLQDEYEAQTTNDEIIYDKRCKLFRKNKTTEKFESRGEGVIKIARDAQSDQYKIMMIRDQIRTFGCNHFIGPEMELLEVARYKRAWTWATLGDVCNTGKNDDMEQIFVIRLETEEESQEFKKCYEKGREWNQEKLNEKIDDDSDSGINVDEIGEENKSEEEVEEKDNDGVEEDEKSREVL